MGSGYYARVFVARELNECEECEQPLLGYWDDYGHGHTPLEALENGLNLAQTGFPHHIYDSHHFISESDE